MHDERRLVEARLRRELREWIKPAIHGRRVLLATEHHVLPGEPEPAAAISEASWTPIVPATPWGRPWGTTWFRATGSIPLDWSSTAVDAIVELGFSGAGPGFQAEGLTYREGIAHRGIHPRRRDLPIAEPGPGKRVELLVEAASNPDFNGSHQPNPLGSLATAGGRPLYTFGGIWLAERHQKVVGLVHDLEVLGKLMVSLSDSDARRHRINRTIEQALDALDLYDIPSTASAARTILEPALAVPARSGEHRLFAIGHAHIDTAWLWPLRESMRKCARTFANAVDLMDHYPEYKFACSQAAQYAWIEEQHPVLFERIREKVAIGQWIPVGGMWVEADMNLPSGESIVRQLIHGQRYFESRFGRRCREVWIPDVFGYPGSLPQIFAAGGCDNFVTQKLSWNKQNKMPHNTFWWEGIDGTRVLTHFPPIDTYNAEMQADQNVFAAANFSDKAWSGASILPFGYGNGGGGPTAEMLERARRMTDLDGVPRVSIEGPETFFDLVRTEAEAAGATTPVWRGELYFEMHRGTLTSQINTKVGNRRCEQLFREVELTWVLVGDHVAYRAVQPELDQLWKDVLVQQFHDIIPGSSIAWVHEEAEAIHTRVADRLEVLIGEAVGRLVTTGATAHHPPGAALVLNPASHHRREVAIFHPGDDGRHFDDVQRLDDGRIAVFIEASGMGTGEVISPQGWVLPVSIEGHSMDNEYLRVTWDSSGRLVSIIDKRTADDETGFPGREVLPRGAFGAELSLAPDHPVEYDAWDVERWTSRRSVPITSVDEIRIGASGPLVAEVTVSRSFGKSHASTTYRLRAGSPRLDIEFDIDWREDEKLLAVNFPIDVHTPTAKCGIQFGHVERPRHENTSWDLAKFEVCAHRWVDVSEPSFGVAILNDSRYGHALHGDGVRVTLLRAPKYPDPNADRGQHRTTLSILPHPGRLPQIIDEAERLTLPVRLVTGVSSIDKPFASSRPIGGSGPTGGSRSRGALGGLVPAGVDVAAVKFADDGSGDVVIRLAEMCGDRRTLVIGPPFGAASAAVTNLHEEPIESLAFDRGEATVTLRPFQLVTLRFSPTRP